MGCTPIANAIQNNSACISRTASTPQPQPQMQVSSMLDRSKGWLSTVSGAVPTRQHSAGMPAESLPQQHHGSPPSDLVAAAVDAAGACLRRRRSPNAYPMTGGLSLGPPRVSVKSGTSMEPASVWNSATAPKQQLSDVPRPLMALTAERMPRQQLSDVPPLLGMRHEVYPRQQLSDIPPLMTGRVEVFPSCIDIRDMGLRRPGPGCPQPQSPLPSPVLDSAFVVPAITSRSPCTYNWNFDLSRA